MYVSNGQFYPVCLEKLDDWDSPECHLQCRCCHNPTHWLGQQKSLELRCPLCRAVQDDMKPDSGRRKDV